MKTTVLAGLLFASLLVAGCAQDSGSSSQQAPLTQGEGALSSPDPQATGIESDLQEMQSSIDDSDFSQFDFLELDQATFN